MTPNLMPTKITKAPRKPRKPRPPRPIRNTQLADGLRDKGFAK